MVAASRKNGVAVRLSQPTGASPLFSPQGPPRPGATSGHENRAGQQRQRQLFSDESEVAAAALEDQAAQLPPSPASSPLAPAPAPEQTADEWGRVRAELADEITPENYVRWFVPTRQDRYEAGVLTVAVPDDFHQQWLDKRLRRVVERYATRVLPGSRVLFVVEENGVHDGGVSPNRRKFCHAPVERRVPWSGRYRPACG